MSKDLLNKIRGAIDNNPAPESAKTAEDKQETAPSKSPKADKRVSKKPDMEPVTDGRALTGFEEMKEILKSEKAGFTFNRRLVYIDENVGEALDLLRKKAKINSNVLASYLLKQFLLENKELIKSLREAKKGNVFFD